MLTQVKIVAVPSTINNDFTEWIPRHLESYFENNRIKTEEAYIN